MTRRTTALLGAALATAAVAAPAADAADKSKLDPAVFESGIPAGVVEHGVIDFTLSGNGQPTDDRTEYWATSTRWRSITRDRSDGTIWNEAWGDEHGTTYFTHKLRPRHPDLVVPKNAPAPEDMPRLQTIKSRSTPPLAGWGPAYNKKLVDRGLLAPVSPLTIAGLSGTLYVVPQERKSTDPDKINQEWVTDETSSRTEIALEDGTLAPLMRQTTKENNGPYGTFVQREELVSRERSTDDSKLREKLSSAAKRKKIKAFKAKIAAFKNRTR